MLERFREFRASREVTLTRIVVRVVLSLAALALGGWFLFTAATGTEVLAELQQDASCSTSTDSDGDTSESCSARARTAGGAERSVSVSSGARRGDQVPVLVDADGDISFGGGNRDQHYIVGGLVAGLAALSLGFAGWRAWKWHLGA